MLLPVWLLMAVILVPVAALVTVTMVRERRARPPMRLSPKTRRGVCSLIMQGTLNPYLAAMPPLGRENGPFGEDGRA